jgi:hypothetical protein
VNNTKATFDAKLLMLPSWLIVQILIPIMPTWNQIRIDKPNLDRWAFAPTDMLVSFSIFFWIVIIGSFLLIVERCI